MPGLYIYIYIDLVFRAVLLSFSKRTIPISLQLEKEIPGAEGLLGLKAAFLSEKDKRTALNARSIWIWHFVSSLKQYQFFVCNRPLFYVPGQAAWHCLAWLAWTNHSTAQPAGHAQFQLFFPILKKGEKDSHELVAMQGEIITLVRIDYKRLKEYSENFQPIY